MGEGESSIQTVSMTDEYTPMGTKSLINELQRFAANVVLRVIVGPDWQIQRLLNAKKQAQWISKWHFDIGSIPHRMTTAVGISCPDMSIVE